MLIPVNWLREYVLIEQPIPALADRLTLAGLEVEEIRESGDETVLDLKITPNRGDWLSLVGVAREVAAVTGAPRRAPEIYLKATGPAASEMTVTIEAPAECPRYVARRVRGAQVGPSPDWLQARLHAAGLRAINNVVDATNYVMLELGQPLHAFDYSTLAGGRIVVRLARSGERIVTIDGTDVALDAQTLVIADAARPVAIAGVMGGRDTEVTDATTDLLLESAYFDPVSVRRTSKAIPLSTAASYRFERHVDPEGTRRAADRAAALIVELAGGEVSQSIVDCQPRPFSPRRIRLRPERIRAMLGMEVSDADARRHLEALELRVEPVAECAGAPPAWEVTVPPFRADLTMEADLVEEVGRLAGYDRLPETLPIGPTHLGRRSPMGRLIQRLREQLIAQGLYEAVTHTLVNRGLLESMRLLQSPAWPVPAGPATLRNPMSEEYNTLRPSLLPGLLLGALYNARRDQEEIFLFEVGWAHAHPEKPGERDRLLVSGVMAGSRWAGAWNVDGDRSAVDFYACKGVVEAIAADLGLGPLRVARTSHPAFHPGRAADVWAGDLPLGALGELHPEVAARLELPARLQMFELDAQALLPYAAETRRYRPPSRFPAVRRDLAVVVDRSVPAEEVRATIAGADPELVREVRLFDVYSGKPLPEEKVSLAFAIQLESEERTLTDVEVDAVLAHARDELARRFAAEFRG